MPGKTPKSPALLIPVRPDAAAEETARSLPSILQSGTRAAGGAVDPFLAEVVVEQTYPLAAVGRGETPAIRKLEDERKLLALEAADGTTVIIRADRLQEELRRLCPEAVGKDGIDLARFRDREATTRGGVDWIWSKLSVLSVGKDAIIDAAVDQALEWAQDWLGEKLQAAAESGASWLGAKALMWAIESRLSGKPGLYQWTGVDLAASDRCAKADPRLEAAAKAGPMLVFIHGTGSHTVGSFKDLRAPGAAADWEPLAKKFGERVFGFEHRTFSESPIDNALALAETLPSGAQLCLVTHSRGGLVGDLLCLGALDDALIEDYRRDAPVNAEENDWQRRIREKVAEEEQRKLRELRGLLETKKLRIERYVRVAAPARGTTLLSDNLDVFLSGLLSLTGKLVGAVTGPAGGAVFSAFKRIVLEIADKRVDARLVPGIEAMLCDSPMGVLLARAPRRQGVEMAVITGDIEGGGILKRLGVMFTDWMFFDRADNDLVVDTSSMYAGLARPGETRYLYDQGERVNHFSYFGNRGTRGPLRDWLTASVTGDVAEFELLVQGREPTPTEAREKARSRAARGGVAPRDSRPVVIVLPGIMGTHLELRRNGQNAGEGNRVWFDLRDLAFGGLRRIRFGEPDVKPEALFEMFYGDLCDHLEGSHLVIPFPYDWRLSVQDAADELEEVARRALEENPSQPLRLLAHSMGGLVVRAMIARHPKVWEKVVERSGSRFVMLGTPNNGSHLMVETLLGKSDTVRQLARLDLRHSMQGLLDIIAGFPGALQLLPRPGFKDSGGAQEDDYFTGTALWDGFRADNKDRWFGDGIVGVPPAEALEAARDLWDKDTLGSANAVPNPEHVAYVYGQAKNTPCGIRIEGDCWKMVGTSEGDGSVTWKSGRLENLPDDRCWHMPVSHGNLANCEAHFGAILDLLQTGETARLGRLPLSRGTAATRTYDAGPTPYPTEEELVRSLLGAAPARPPARATRLKLAVRVVAMDLRHVQLPVMCGHYIGDPIAGAESQIDQHVVARALCQRERLGIYAGKIGTSAIVLNPRGEEDLRRGTGRGAVIVGLGELGKLSLGDVTETVRTGVLRYLLQAQDRRTGPGGAQTDSMPAEVGLASLLIGYNSTANISVDDAVSAIVRGVCEANRQFDDAMQPKLRVGRLELIELFLDSAITAANAVRSLPRRMERDLQRLNVTLEAADRLIQGEGVRQRLAVTSPFGYWPRLMISDADRADDEPGSEPGKSQLEAPAVADVLREYLEEERRRVETGGAAPGSSNASKRQRPSTTQSPAAPAPAATRLKYVMLSARARAEAIEHQRQPGLVEALVRNAIHDDRFDPDLAHTLFQLMVPLDFKAAVRDSERLLLMLDSYTANLPWEMLQADDEPMVLKTRIVRQLVSTRFRRMVRPSTNKTACIIADPSTEGFQESFAQSQPLPRLPGAEAEGTALRELLGTCGYDVGFTRPESKALDVMALLFKRSYRILMVAAHGEFGLTARDGRRRSGVILSDGLLLTAAEIGQLEVVPDLVFLNCCHLGQVDAPRAYNRLSYSLASELIEIGVRCVVAAGWKVNDQAAQTFSETFFAAFVQNGLPFGEAVHEARGETYARHPGSNTWGAYQAYGDPGFVLEPSGGSQAGGSRTFVAVQELVAELQYLRLAAQHDEWDLERTTREARDRQGAAPAEWSNLPEIQYALGALYSDFGLEGFELACAAYQRAIAEDDKFGRVPVKAIEQLANLEARKGRQRGGTEGLALIDRAIQRLEGLLSSTGSPLPGQEIAHRANAERCSLLAGALKRKADLLGLQGAGWTQVEKALKQCRDAYAAGAGDPGGTTINPYPALNRLQLDGLLQDVDSSEIGQLIQLARRCAEQARERFASTYDFFDAVMAADAELAIRMIDRSLPTSAADLVEAYRNAVSGVPSSARQFDSVVGQLELLARFYRLGGADDGLASADALSEIARRLDPKRAASAAPADADVDTAVLPEVAESPPARVPPVEPAAEEPASTAPKKTRKKRARKRKP